MLLGCCIGGARATVTSRGCHQSLNERFNK